MLKAGEVLNKVKYLCKKEKKKILEYIKSLNVNWSRSYISFLISLYDLAKRYPKLKSVTVSLHYINQNFRKIRNHIENCSEERMFWLKE